MNYTTECTGLNTQVWRDSRQEYLSVRGCGLRGQDASHHFSHRSADPVIAAEVVERELLFHNSPLEYFQEKKEPGITRVPGEARKGSRDV